MLNTFIFSKKTLFNNISYQRKIVYLKVKINTYFKRLGTKSQKRKKWLNAVDFSSVDM